MEDPKPKRCPVCGNQTGRTYHGIYQPFCTPHLIAWVGSAEVRRPGNGASALMDFVNRIRAELENGGQP